MVGAAGGSIKRYLQGSKYLQKPVHTLECVLRWYDLNQSLIDGNLKDFGCSLQVLTEDGRQRPVEPEYN